MFGFTIRTIVGDCNIGTVLVVCALEQMHATPGAGILRSNEANNLAVATASELHVGITGCDRLSEDQSS